MAVLSGLIQGGCSVIHGESSLQALPRDNAPSSAETLPDEGLQAADVQRDSAHDLDGDRLFRAYLNAVRQRPRLSAAEEAMQFERLRDPQPAARIAARSLLVQANLWLVPVVVRRFRRQGNGFEDLVAEGNLGLYQALNRFDPARGLRFSTYAKWWVMHVVTASMAANAYPLRVPRRIALQLARQRRAANDAPLAEAALAPADAPDTGDDAGMAHDSASPAAPQALSTPFAQAYDAESDPRAADAQQQPDVSLALKQGLQLLTAALAELPARERAVIEARYGLNGQEARTLQDVAHELGLSAEGVRKIQLAAMARLKRKLALDWL
jgi:RNA polymerase sigma factor (sigma-70 family)